MLFHAFFEHVFVFFGTAFTYFVTQNSDVLLDLFSYYNTVKFGFLANLHIQHYENYTLVKSY